ncbi:phosphotransferase [Cellulosimicrobium sp. Marseille-Q4280]|uniref:phosphotransferase enzyme family protein n=1 Tax=Cellulosimicrobium sp. Marseille-Q4280 TaxID=2937992 RepID=UPI00203F15FE|nr:phosphotransferase [Cellulosimicrobium sp. Marseille-Q4280]
MADTSLPTLEMLWEACDPHDALAERFGLQDAGSAARWVATVLDDHWGVRVDACERIVISDHNALAWVATPSGDRLAKWSVVPERFARLTQVARLTHWLHREGLPVSAPVRSLDGDLQVEVDDVTMSLQDVVDGELLDVDDPQQVRAAGAVLARLHLALATYPDADRAVAPAAPPAPVATRVSDWLGSLRDHVPAAARTILRRLVDDAPADRLPTQLVHGDFRSSNVICRGRDVAAVIDLEEVRLDHCVVEVARSAVMLGTRYRNWGPVSAEVRATFLAGYETVRPLTPAEAGWWDTLVLWHAWALVPPGEDPTGWGRSAHDQLEDLARAR